LKKGLFITFEGIEGSGKSTQIIMLAEYLKAEGREVTVTREPGGTEIGRAIRQVLLNPGFTKMDYHTEVLLYAADRAQHAAEIIKPSLAEGKIVLSDRYIDSSIAYQHYGRGLPLDLIMNINEQAVQGLKPDLTFLLALPLEIGLKRATQETSDRIEQESIAFHGRVEAGFRELASKEPQRWHVIDATGTIDEIHQSITEVVNTLLSSRD